MSAPGFTNDDAVRFYTAIRHALVTCKWPPRAFGVEVVRWTGGSLLARVRWSLVDRSFAHEQDKATTFASGSDEFDACLWAADLHEQCVRDQRLPWSVPK